MPSDIYMPALGMSQNTGVIAEWHKQPGDPVAVGDALMSVETDKAVQEIEAADAGFLGRILFPAGAEVPVGEVVASIVENPADTPANEAPASSPEPRSEPEPATSPEEPPPPTAKPASAPTPASPPKTGRPLASPKARRLVRERGLDLAAIWQQSGYRPVLAANVETYHAPSPGVAETPTSMAATPTLLSLSVPAARLLDFTHWLQEQAGEPASVGLVTAWFLAGVWRRHGDSDDPIHVDIVSYADRAWTHEHIHDVDRGGLLALWQNKSETGAEHPATLTVMDFTRSTIRAASSQSIGTSGCILSFDSNAKETLNLSLISTTVSIEALASMAGELAALLEQPLNALLH